MQVGRDTYRLCFRMCVYSRGYAGTKLIQNYPWPNGRERNVGRAACVECCSHWILHRGKTDTRVSRSELAPPRVCGLSIAKKEKGNWRLRARKKARYVFSKTQRYCELSSRKQPSLPNGNRRHVSSRKAYEFISSASSAWTWERFGHTAGPATKRRGKSFREQTIVVFQGLIGYSTARRQRRRLRGVGEPTPGGGK